VPYGNCAVIGKAKIANQLLGWGQKDAYAYGGASEDVPYVLTMQPVEFDGTIFDGG